MLPAQVRSTQDDIDGMISCNAFQNDKGIALDIFLIIAAVPAPLLP